MGLEFDEDDIVHNNNHKEEDSLTEANKGTQIIAVSIGGKKSNPLAKAMKKNDSTTENNDNLNTSSKEAVEKEEQEVEQEEVEEQQASEPVVNEAPTPVKTVEKKKTRFNNDLNVDNLNENEAVETFNDLYEQRSKYISDSPQEDYEEIGNNEDIDPSRLSQLENKVEETHNENKVIAWAIESVQQEINAIAEEITSLNTLRSGVKKEIDKLSGSHRAFDITNADLKELESRMINKLSSKINEGDNKTVVKKSQKETKISYSKALIFTNLLLIATSGVLIFDKFNTKGTSKLYIDKTINNKVITQNIKKGTTIVCNGAELTSQAGKIKGLVKDGLVYFNVQIDGNKVECTTPYIPNTN